MYHSSAILFNPDDVGRLDMFQVFNRVVHAGFSAKEVSYGFHPGTQVVLGTSDTGDLLTIEAAPTHVLYPDRFLRAGLDKAIVLFHLLLFLSSMDNAIHIPYLVAKERIIVRVGSRL